MFNLSFYYTERKKGTQMHTNEEIDYVSQSLPGFRTLLGGLTTLADSYQMYSIKMTVDKNIFQTMELGRNHRQFSPLPNRPLSNRPPEKSILVKSAPLEIKP